MSGQYNDFDDTRIKGNTDDTYIGNVSDRLKVDANFSNSVTGSYSSKARLDASLSSVTLSTGSYTTIYNYSGTGYLIGFSVEFNNSSIIPRLQVDGETIFDTLTTSQWSSLQVTNNSTDRRQSGSGLVVSGANIDFSFRNPIKFTSGINIAADANGGVVLSRTATAYLVYIVKET